MKKEEFPKVIRVGHTRATIYKTPTRGCDAFTVAWYEGAVRKRKAFADLAAAELHANAMVNSLSKGEAEILRLSGEELLSYTRAKAALSEFNIAVDSAAIEYRDAKRLLRGGSLLEAARYYAANRLHEIPRKTVSEVYQEMLTAKRAEGLSERYIDDLESRVGKFANDFQVQIAAVKGPEIKTWLQELKTEGPKNKKVRDPKATPVAVSNRTRNNHRLCLQTLFSYAKSQRYLPKDWNELDDIPLWKTKREEVEIFTPEEFGRLLNAAVPKLVPFLAIGGFAGLRSAEIERLDWSKVNFATGYITVDASIAKTNSRRLVPISANLRLWLEPHAKESGPVVEIGNVAKALQQLSESTRVVDPDNKEKVLTPAIEWRHNALRHSFCSYRLAEVKSAAQVALEAGNSPTMIFKHYRELVTEADAKRWFAILPVVNNINEEDVQTAA